MSEAHDRLDSWKAIAEYLDRDPTTVMRWARERGLPVYVVPGQGQRHRAVYAYTSEIDAWLRKPADRGAPPRQNDRHDQVAHSDELHAEEPGQRAASSGNREQGTGYRKNDAQQRSQSADVPASRISGNEGSSSGPSAEETAEGTEESRKSLTSRARSFASLRMTGEGLGMTTLANLFRHPAKGTISSPPSSSGTRLSLRTVFLCVAILIALAGAAWLRVPPPEPKVLGVEQLTNDGFDKEFGLATDGARVYFIENSRDGYVVAEIPSTGGSPVAIARANPDSSIQDISPDRSQLLLIRDARFRPGSVWILPLVGGAARRLGSIQAFSAAWSPDGAALAYTTDDGLYLCDSDGSNSRRIVAMSGRLANVHWSPDGRRLCLGRTSAGKASLWEVDREGKGLRPLFPDRDLPRDETSCFWTSNGEFLIFQAFYAGHVVPWIVRLSTGLLKRNEEPTCLGPAGLSFREATISPDGSRLYGIGGARSRSEIEHFDARSKQLVPNQFDVAAYDVDFSKDGECVAYMDDQGSLWKSRKDGGEKVQLTLPPLAVELPRWSPDGKWIAFMGKEPGQPWRVRLVSAEGGAYDPVTSTGTAEGAPTWSADGARVAFGGIVNSSERAPGPLVIHIFDIKKHDLSVVPGSEGLWTARWSPDGRYIAALTEDSHSLMLFDFQTRKWTKLLTLGQILDLQWSRKGKSVYLSATSPEGERALYWVRIPGHQAERLTSLEGTNFSGWLGLAPDDSPLVERLVTGNEIYALQCRFP